MLAKVESPQRDSFTFIGIIKTSNLGPFSVFLSSFDISSLFTNFPLAETIQISSEPLFLQHLFLGKSFLNSWRCLLLLSSLASTTSCIARSTRVAMGSPLANIFVGYYESKLFQTTSKPEMYYLYMDDTFAVSSIEDEGDLLLHSLNILFALVLKKTLTWLFLFWACWLKKPFQLHHLYLSETLIHWSISTLDFLQSTETQNSFNPALNSPGSCHLFSWKTATWTRQNQVYSID